jgi:Vam6/Vps39-like protein vacuolar protein sorting-associated protein 39
LKSAIGITTARPQDDDEFDSLTVDPQWEATIANFHDELSFMLLEGLISHQNDNFEDQSTNGVGRVYQSMLRKLLKWQLARIRPDLLMESLPPSFLLEKALLFGRLGRHDDALRILYGDLKSLDLSLEHCDDRYSRQKAQYERLCIRQQHQNRNAFSDTDGFDDLEMKDDDNAYIPLIRVALESRDSKEGTAAAIRVLTLQRGAVDRAAALRLLPTDVQVSAVARPFLIPALVDSESHVRRMAVVAALSRARYLRLTEKLTAAQLKAQSNIHIVPAMRNLNLGDLLHSTKSFRARATSATPGNNLPYIEIVKHFPPRHLVIQTKVTNVAYSSVSTAASTPLSLLLEKIGTGSDSVVLSQIAFVVAECFEEESIQPLLQVPIQLLPPNMTGSAWCVLSAFPGNFESPSAQLACELRYTVHLADSALQPIRSMSQPLFHLAPLLKSCKKLKCMLVTSHPKCSSEVLLVEGGLMFFAAMYYLCTERRGEM